MVKSTITVSLLMSVLFSYKARVIFGQDFTKPTYGNDHVVQTQLDLKMFVDQKHG